LWSLVTGAVLGVGLVGVPAHADEDVLGAPVVVLDPDVVWNTSWWVQASWSVEYAGGLSGWALGIDDVPVGDPGEVVTQTDDWWAGELSDGVWWLHVRAVDAEGVAGPVADVRIGVDGTGPVVEGLTSSTHTAGEPSGSSVVGLSWDEPVDVSGVVGYQVEVEASRV
jgi:hypothetical protein